MLQFSTRILNALLPQSCFLCGAINHQAICHACLGDLPVRRNACQRCGRSLPAMLSVSTCAECQFNPPPFDSLQAPFNYVTPIRELMHAAKYSGKLAILYCLGELLADHLKVDSLPDVIMPVPLHWRRLQTRGYNQSLELAKCIERRLAVPIDSHACVRWRPTLPQVQLSARERRINVRGAFRINYWQPHWQHIALVDDVVTHGATSGEITRLLLASGAQRVDVWCCVRA